LRDYEAVLIVDPGVDEMGLTQVGERFASLIEGSGGSVRLLRSLGRRRLAYRIRGYDEGIYVITQFSSEPAAIDGLTNELRLSERIIRSMIVRLEEGAPAKEEAAAEEAAVAPEAEVAEGGPEEEMSEEEAPLEEGIAEAPEGEAAPGPAEAEATEVAPKGGAEEEGEQDVQ